MLASEEWPRLHVYWTQQVSATESSWIAAPHSCQQLQGEREQEDVNGVAASSLPHPRVKYIWCSQEAIRNPATPPLLRDSCVSLSLPKSASLYPSGPVS